jgi:purine catabolism regulator
MLMGINIKDVIESMRNVRSYYGQDSLTVEEVLNLPEFKGYKLLGGEAGLQRRCRHITILETPTGIDWLEGEEFLVTAGYAFINNEEYKKRMLIDAHKKNVSAIAIKEKRYFGEISRELIDQADRFEVPLIQLPYDVVYTRTISSFYNMLFYRKNEYILKLNNIYEKLLNLSFENRDIDGIIYSLSNLSNSSVFLLDGSLNLICYNIINPSKFDRLSPVSPFNKNFVKLVEKIKDYTVNLRIDGFFISFYPISINEKDIAYVYIVNDYKLDKLSQRTIEYGISMISARLEREHNSILAQTRINRTLLEIILNNKGLPDEFYRNVELNLNWDTRGFIYGICIKLHSKEDEDIGNCKIIIYNYLDNIIGKNNYLSTDKSMEIFVFIKFEYRDSIKDFISNIMEYIKGYTDIFTASIGISNPYRGIKSIRRCYDEAYLSALFANQNVIYYSSIDTIKLLYPLKDDDVIQQYYDKTIKKLEEYDKKNGTDLLETLETYLKYNLKKTLVAEKLFIHVETLRYRLNRIEEITGYSLEDTEGLFALQMGLIIKKLLEIK